MIDIDKIITSLKEKWDSQISINSTPTECAITFPFMDRNCNRVVVYLSQKGYGNFNVGVVLKNSLQLNTIHHGLSFFKRDKEVKELFSYTCNYEVLPHVITDAVSVSLIYN